jgi:hypothetical protein
MFLWWAFGITAAKANNVLCRTAEDCHLGVKKGEIEMANSYPVFQSIGNAQLLKCTVCEWLT